MKWKKYSFDTNTASVDLISAELDELGIEGIEIEDHVPLTESETKGMFVDILPDLGPDDGSAVVSFYLDADADNTERLEEVKAALEELRSFSDIGPCEIRESETEDKDWINNWKEFFHPITLGRVRIQPTWEPLEEEDRSKVLIRMDPGTAFGTGGHETTQLCILQLDKYISERNRRHMDTEVLDVGTGSGILGIVALRLGARRVFGTDLDENAVEAVKENMKSNAVMPSEFTVACGNIIDDRGIQFAAGFRKYDIVVANILAPVIIGLIGEVGRHMKKDALFITSGIIDTKEEDVKAAFEASPEFEIAEINRLGEWVNITARFLGPA